MTEYTKKPVVERHITASQRKMVVRDIGTGSAHTVVGTYLLDRDALIELRDAINEQIDSYVEVSAVDQFDALPVGTQFSVEWGKTAGGSETKSAVKINDTEYFSYTKKFILGRWGLHTALSITAEN